MKRIKSVTRLAIKNNKLNYLMILYTQIDILRINFHQSSTTSLSMTTHVIDDFARGRSR